MGAPPRVTDDELERALARIGARHAAHDPHYDEMGLDPSSVLEHLRRHSAGLPHEVQADDIADALAVDAALWWQDPLIAGAKPGCVYPDFVPTLSTMTQLPNIANNIRAVQAKGNHLGRAADGTPLTRNSSLQNANRAKARPSSATPPAAGLSCDEYPFATTDQGASKAPAGSWGSTWVPEGEQNSQGGLLTSFYNSNRVLDGNGTGDKYWVAV